MRRGVVISSSQFISPARPRSVRRILEGERPPRCRLRWIIIPQGLHLRYIRSAAGWRQCASVNSPIPAFHRYAPPGTESEPDRGGSRWNTRPTRETHPTGRRYFRWEHRLNDQRSGTSPSSRLPRRPALPHESRRDVRYARHSSHSHRTKRRTKNA